MRSSQAYITLPRWSERSDIVPPSRAPVRTKLRARMFGSSWQVTVPRTRSPKCSRTRSAVTSRCSKAKPASSYATSPTLQVSPLSPERPCARSATRMSHLQQVDRLDDVLARDKHGQTAYSSLSGGRVPTAGNAGGPVVVERHALGKTLRASSGVRNGRRSARRSRAAPGRSAVAAGRPTSSSIRRTRRGRRHSESRRWPAGYGGTRCRAAPCQASGQV